MLRFQFIPAFSDGEMFGPGGLVGGTLFVAAFTWGLETFEADPEEPLLFSDVVEVFGTSPFELKNKIQILYMTKQYPAQLKISLFGIYLAGARKYKSSIKHKNYHYNNYNTAIIMSFLYYYFFEFL